MSIVETLINFTPPIKSEKSPHVDHGSMVLGTCVISSPSGRTALRPESIVISGKQEGFLVTLTVKQVFRHSCGEAQNICYLVPNNSKICMYGTTFRIGDDEIRVFLEEKKAAKTIFIEATEEGRAALLGQNLGNGLVEFSLGNVPPGQPCEVSVECAFTASSSGLSSTFFKFPLDVCTPSGSVSCVTNSLSGTFQFTLENCEPSSVSEITANVPSTYDASTGLLRINAARDVPALLITTTLRSPLRSLGVRSGRLLSVTVFNPLQTDNACENNEFIFIIDCSGSMGGPRIKQARTCLTFFIRSLPPSAFFNIIRFGSSFEPLFPEAVAYETASANRALRLVASLEADLGGTDIYAPLAHVYGQPLKGSGVRQLFLITDGEVSDTDRVIDLGRAHASQNRCFAIGIGSGADAGLIEGLASATGGRSDFTSADVDLPEKVIRQLEASLSPGLVNVVIDVSGQDGLEFVPFPIPSVTASVSQTVFGLSPEPLVSGEVLVSGDVLGTRLEERISCGETAIPEAALQALFAFETIRCYERSKQSEASQRKHVISLSIASGVLCKETAFVGFSDRIYSERPTLGLPQSRALVSECCGAALPAGSGRRPPSAVCAMPMCCAAAPPPGPARDTATEALSSDDPLLRLVVLQSIDGSWSDAEAVKSVAGVTVDPPAELTLNLSAFATALAIAILRKRFADLKSQWQLIERKALRWLSGQIGDDGATKAIDLLLAAL
jgi:hypothetical protein